MEKLHAPAIIGRTEQPGAPSVAWVPLLALVAWAASLRVGLLADDFDLVPGAQGARLAELAWGFTHSYTAPPVAVYRPLYLSLFILDGVVWGGSVTGYHVINVLLQALNSTLLVGVARGLGWSSRAAWTAGALFAVHPLAIGAAGWISGRGDLAATSFVLGATLALLRYAGSGRRAWLGLVMLLALGGLLTKENAVVLFIWMAILALRPPRIRLTHLLGPVAVALAYLAFRLRVIGPLRGYFDPLDVHAHAVLGGLMRLGLSVASPVSDGVLRSRALDVGLAVTVWAGALLAVVRRARVRPALLAAALLLTSVLPVLPLLIVSRGLYDSRHYYLPLAPAALLLALAVDALPGPAIALLLAALVGATQLNIEHWRRNAALAQEIVEATSRVAARLPAGGRIGVAGYRDLTDGHFLFLGNSLQAAVARAHPGLADRQIQCLGTGLCPPEATWPADAPLLRLDVAGYSVRGARLERGTIDGL